MKKVLKQFKAGCIESVGSPRVNKGLHTKPSLTVGLLTPSIETKSALIAGIGNIFFGDDAFGCEVVTILQIEILSDSVKPIDFGIRTRDLAYELCENYDVVILIDAVKLGNPSGTVSLIELNPNDFTTQNSKSKRFYDPKLFCIARGKVRRNFEFCSNFRCKI